MITLGDIRKAGEGLPDNTPVFLVVTNDPEPFVDVEFTNVQSNTSSMSVRILAEVDIDEDTEEEEEPKFGNWPSTYIRENQDKEIDRM